MIHFTYTQINELVEILQKSHWLFIASHVNPDIVPKSVMRDLIKMGFSKTKITKYPELAFHFGLLSVYLKDSDVKKLSFYKLKQSLKAGKLLPLSEIEKQAVRIAEMRAVEGITGLGNKISSTLRTLIIEGSAKKRHEYEKIIKTAATKAIAKRESVRALASEIGHKTGDWARDLDRIADYILHEAYDNGRAFAVKKKYGNDALVYKRVHKDACDKCKKLYLKDKITWEPKIFKLADLMANGTNIGVPANKWKPVIGAVHPWCRCDLEYIPEGYVWDKKTRSFKMKVDKRKLAYDFTGKSKAKIEITNN